MINFLWSRKSELLQLACELSAMLNYLKKKKGEMQITYCVSMTEMTQNQSKEEFYCSIIVKENSFSGCKTEMQ